MPPKGYKKAVALADAPVLTKPPDVYASEILTDEVLSTGKRHLVARCRWCDRAFVRVWAQWICPNHECAQRQINHAILKQVPIPGQSPFFYLPLPLQVDTEESPVKRLLVWGPVGISKSFGGRMSLYSRCRRLPGYQALLLRVTLRQLEANHIIHAVPECAALGDASYVTTKTSQRVAFTNGSNIWMGYCDSVGDIAGHTGQEYDEVLMEEAVHFLPQAINVITSRDRGSSQARETMIALDIEEGRSRLLTNSLGRAQQFLGEHYVTRTPNKRDYPKYNPQWYGAITGDIRDNPYLSSTFQDSVLGGLDTDRYDSYANGDWNATVGRFFRDFNAERHVVDHHSR